MVKVVVVNGSPGSGKTTFEKMCDDKCFFDNEPGYYKNTHLTVKLLSTVDRVKELALTMGWDGTKSPRNRKFLSDLKDLLTNWNDLPFRAVKHEIDHLCKEGGDWLVFVDCREPEEIQRFKDTYNATTLLIRRESAETAGTSNHADANVLNYEYDLIIENNSDIIDLENKVDSFIEYMRGAPHYEYNGQ